MNPFVVSVFYVLVWRLCVLACGLVCVVLGYRLFLGGFAAQQASVEAGVGGNSLKMSNVAPGTFFALFGAAIITALVWTSPAEIVVPKDAVQAAAQLDMGPQGLTVRSEE